jgi:hypothetical protein
MEPQTLQTPPSQVPQPEPAQQPTPSPVKKKMSKKILALIICGVLLFVILLTIGVKALLDSSTNKTAGNGLDSAIYYMRDGYNIKDYGLTIGDPLALTMDKLDKPFKSSVGPVVYACNVLSMKDLAAQKAYFEPRSDAKALTRTFIDGVGKEGVEKNIYTLPTGDDDDNNCSYGLQAGGILNISVLQPPFTATSAITDELGRYYTKADSINGLAMYTYNRDDASRKTYMLVSGGEAVYVLFNSTKVTPDVQKKLLGIVANNFTDQHAHPKGPALSAYDTPTYKKAYAKACNFISNDDIKALTGSNASIYATESLASGTGVAKVAGKLYNSISASCSRYNTGLGSGLTAGPFDQKLEVTMTSFNADAPAKLYMEDTAKDAAEKTPMSVGDEAFGYRDTSDQNTVVFRQGRFIVELMLDRTVQANAGLQQTAAMTQKLTPYAQQVAAKLKTMQ